METIEFLMNKIDLIFQFVGIIVILAAQIVFWIRTYKEYHSLKKAFIDLTCPRFGMDDEKLKRISGVELEQALKRFPLAKMLYEDFKISLFGLILTFIGLLLSLCKI